MMEYPSDDIGVNLDFFGKLQAEYTEAKRNDRDKQVASSERRIEELRRVTPGHGAPSSAFVAGDNPVNRVKNILSAGRVNLKFTNKATPPIDNGIPTSNNNGIAYSSSSPLIRAPCGSSSSNAPSSAPRDTTSSDSFFTFDNLQLQGEVITLLKISTSYMSTDTFENVKSKVLELFGDINSLNTFNIVWLPKNLFISDPPVLKPAVRGMFTNAKFEFQTAE